MDKIFWSVPQHELETEAVNQAYKVASTPPVVEMAIMPDCHVGYTVPIGAVVQTDPNHICPAFVGYDIGCGMYHMKLVGTGDISLSNEQKQSIFDTIHAKIGLGFDKTEHISDLLESYSDVLDESLFYSDLHTSSTMRKHTEQFASLGGGNHFIEIGRASKCNSLCITIHSGSRGFGYGVAEFWMGIAKTHGTNYSGISYLTNQQLKMYYKDVHYAQQWAYANREAMAKTVYAIIRDEVGYDNHAMVINENHNTVEKNVYGYIHRKGATPAEEGQLGIIPINQRDGIYITRGLGNEQWLCSASHGAGRVLSRSKAKKVLDVETFKAQMSGVVSEVSKHKLDEAPDAYKKAEYVIGAQEGHTVDIVDTIKPLIVVKG